MRPQYYLDTAKAYADIYSGCLKVAVGSLIVKDGDIISAGANRVLDNECRKYGCHRVRLYGEDSKSHRNPEDCLAIHSEIDAISKTRTSLSGATIYVTRYPCEGCAKAIIAAGIHRVYYGGTTKISPLTQKMFDFADIAVVHVEDWAEDHTDR